MNSARCRKLAASSGARCGGRALGVEMDDSHVAQLVGTMREGLEQDRWRRGAAVDEDLVAGSDVGDCLGG